MKIAKADLFSGLNNFRECGVLDKKYSKHFGFTEGEVDQLLANNLLGNTEVIKQQRSEIES